MEQDDRESSVSPGWRDSMHAASKMRTHLVSFREFSPRGSQYDLPLTPADSSAPGVSGARLSSAADADILDVPFPHHWTKLWRARHL
eukprot:scaffold47_cov258-Pinguiococcus_pyrenoidosus.AAC.112